MGSIAIKTSERNGPVVGARLVTDEDELMLITNKGQIIRMPVSGISTVSRNTQGVTLMSMDKGELVVGMARLISEDDEDESEIEGGEVEGAEVDAEASGEDAAAGEEE